MSDDNVTVVSKYYLSKQLGYEMVKSFYYVSVSAFLSLHGNLITTCGLLKISIVECCLRFTPCGYIST